MSRLKPPCENQDDDDNQDDAEDADAAMTIAVAAAAEAAALRQAFTQADRAQASQTLRHMADQLRQKWPKLAAFIDDSETDVLSHLDFPEHHRTKLHSTDEIDKPPLQTKPSFFVRPRGAVFLFFNRGPVGKPKLAFSSA